MAGVRTGMTNDQMLGRLGSSKYQNMFLGDDPLARAAADPNLQLTQSPDSRYAQALGTAGAGMGAAGALGTMNPYMMAAGLAMQTIGQAAQNKLQRADMQARDEREKAQATRQAITQGGNVNTRLV